MKPNSHRHPICQYYILKIAALISLTTFVAISSVNGQQDTYCEQANMIVKTVSKYHFNPRPIDAEYSELVISNYVNLLDPYGLYLTQNEVTQLKNSAETLGSEIKSGDCSFFQYSVELYKNKLVFIDSLLSVFLQEEFDFQKADSLQINEDYIIQDKCELVKRWRNMVKYHSLYLYYNTNELTDNSGDIQQLQMLKNKVVNQYKCVLSAKYNSNGSPKQYVGIHYLKAIALAFDPHTNYFTTTEEKAFAASLSKEEISFGFEITRNNYNEIEILQVVPGSPAWNTNSINEGDIILQVNVNDSITRFDCIAMHDVIKLLSSGDVSEAEFLIRKADNKELTVKINKDVVDVDDNVINSFILNGKHKVGYIYLPSFYSYTDQPGYLPKGCANDVAKELIKLKNEGINGLIIDLRNNGGGSMIEALLLSGIFIDYGAIGIAHSKDQEPRTLKDINRGVIYSDPMLLLINEYSASASELFASAMQDHNRAVVAGAKSFGKTTMQQIVPIDAYKYSSFEEFPDNADGYIKITNGVFHRVTGEVLQKKGITPNISLPSIYDSIDVGEKSYSAVLEVDNIEKKTYYYPSDPLPVKELKLKSEARVDSSIGFNNIKKLNIAFIEEQNGNFISLKNDDFHDYILKSKQEDEVENSHTSYTVTNPSYFQGISSVSDSTKEINEHIMIQIHDDIYIGESFNILTDLIDNIK